MQYMQYEFVALSDSDIPEARDPLFQHMLDTYASETNKVVTTWRGFTGADLAYRPHPKSSSVLEILRHQLLSERRFFGEFLGSPEPRAELVLPTEGGVEGFCQRMKGLAVARLAFLAARDREWWLESASFFGQERERIWIFWRRVLHTSHHRTQLTVYLRLLDRPVPSTYGPTADVTWTGADPTNTVAAAARK
jgi:uncharacterized damage-inducible protein DinB